MTVGAAESSAGEGASPAYDWLRAWTVSADVTMATGAGAPALEARRQTRLDELLRATYAQSAYYRRLWGRDPAGLRFEDLPAARKRDLMAAFDDWVADPEVDLASLRRFTADPTRIADPYLGRYVVWESSGSSGEPGIFIQDASAMAVYDALEAVRRPVMQPLQRFLDPWALGERYAFVGAVGGHFASTVSIERIRRLNPALAPRLASISFLQPTVSLVAELNRVAPTIIATYPSAAVLLAEERRAGRLRIVPREVWTGGENLSPPMRRFVREAFDCPVTDSYGASEFLALASECALGHLHLNSDWAILEPVDAHGRPMPAGKAGATTLLTNLANRVQPLIRYDLGDRVAVHAPGCPCGSALPVIDVQGRCDQTLHFRGVDDRPVSLLPLALSTILEDEAGLFDFRLVQQGPADLLLTTGLRGTSAGRALRRARLALTTFLLAQGIDRVRIRCRSGEPCLPGRSGKIQRVIASGPAAGGSSRSSSAGSGSTSSR